MYRCSRFIALLFGLACCAGAFAQSIETPEYYIGRKFWYEPKHEKYAPIDFHRVPDFDQGKFHVYSKARFEVTAFGRGWFKLRFESGYGDAVYLPARMLRSKLYVPTVGESYAETFRKAAIFEEDPDAIKLRLDRAAKPAAATSTPKSWIRYRGTER